MKKHLLLLFVLLSSILALPQLSSAATVTQAKKTVTQAEVQANVLRKQIDFSVSKKLIVLDSNSVSSLQSLSTKAKAEVHTLKGKDKSTLSARMKKVDLVLTQAQAHANGWKAAEQLKNDTNSFLAIVKKEPFSSRAATAYKNVTISATKQVAIIHKVQIASTQDALVQQYQKPYEQAVALYVSTLNAKKTIEAYRANASKVAVYQKTFANQLATVKDPALKGLLQNEWEKIAIVSLYQSSFLAFNNEDANSIETKLDEDMGSVLNKVFKLFKEYNCKISVKSVQVIEVKGNNGRAHISIAFTGEKPAILPTAVEFTQALTKDQGTWKFTDDVNVLSME